MDVKTIYSDSRIRITRRAEADPCMVGGRLYEYALSSNDGLFCLTVSREDVARYIRSLIH